MATQERDHSQATGNPSVRAEDERTAPSMQRRGSHGTQGGHRRNGQASQEERLAYGLGWFGMGLGLAELAAPDRMARLIGAPSEHRTLIRAMGLREIASGVGIITQRAPAGAVWSRVAGDALDLACLAAAFFSARANRPRLAAATAAVAGATVLDVLCAQQLSRGMHTINGEIPVKVTLAINRSAEELYRYWRDFSNLPGFMKHLRSVRVADGRSHWVASGPAGTTVEWDAEVTEDRPNEVIAWRSLEGADVDHSGSVRFEPAPGRDRGTFVTVEMRYRPPGGTLGSAVAAWFGEDPHQSVKMDVRRFKQLMETGDMITTEGQPAGRPQSTSWKYDTATRR